MTHSCTFFYVFIRNLSIFALQTQVENHNDQQGHNSNEISAEVHVQVHSGARNNPDRGVLSLHKYSQSQASF